MSRTASEPNAAVIPAASRFDYVLVEGEALDAQPPRPAGATPARSPSSPRRGGSMMNMSRRRTAEEREERRARRTERETTAGTLHAKVPDLVSLDIAIHESRPDGCYDSHYIRRVVIGHAAALFEVSCTYSDCEGGGYDLTNAVLAALAARQTRFEGQQPCHGKCNLLDCTRVLRYVATAEYHTGSDA